MSFPTADRADVALLLEGTYPFIAGGVSSWVNQIITGFPDLTFACYFLGSRRRDYGAMKYTLPKNVVHLETHYLFETTDAPKLGGLRGDKAAYEKVRQLHERFREPGDEQAQRTLFAEVLNELGDTGKLDRRSFLYSQEAWDYITDHYLKNSTDPSFVDYFWSVRTMHAPLWVLNNALERLVPVRAVHTISTGYAGFLGAMAKHRYGLPLVLSEHGIYTKERKIDLFQSEWMRDNRGVFEKRPDEASYFKQLWLRFFETLGRGCYDAADIIVALYENNRQRQIQDGAPPERTCTVPNGIDLPRFDAVRGRRNGPIPPVLCLIGRVVPIKDIKTFIRAMRSVVNQIPNAEGWIAGPDDEAPEYAEECRRLVASLGLDGHIKFLGFQKIDELLPTIGLNVLSSISEALPLVVLEGFAAGVPALCTDVGSCRQLIFGLEDDDRALGAAGDVVGIADPQALAQAAVRLLTDPRRWHAAQSAGLERVRRYYTQERMFSRYRNLYEHAFVLNTPRPAVAGCPFKHSPTRGEA